MTGEHVKRFIKLDDANVLLGIKVATSDDMEVTEAGYGWVIEPDHGEWAMTIQFTYRQDHMVAWAIMHAAVDGDIAVMQGLHSYERWVEAVEKAIYHLTTEWLPDNQINAPEDEDPPVIRRSSRYTSNDEGDHA